MGFSETKISRKPALTYDVEKKLHEIDSGKYVVVLFVDFKKLFNSISHSILLKKLSACGASNPLHECHKCYLHNRTLFTAINRASSKKSKLRKNQIASS